MQVNSKVTVIWLKPDQMFLHHAVVVGPVKGHSEYFRMTSGCGWVDRQMAFVFSLSNANALADILTPPLFPFHSPCFVIYLPILSFSDSTWLLCSVIFPPHPHCVFPFILHYWNQRWWPSSSSMQYSLSLGIAGHKQAKVTAFSCLHPYLNLAKMLWMTYHRCKLNIYRKKKQCRFIIRVIQTIRS